MKYYSQICVQIVKAKERQSGSKTVTEPDSFVSEQDLFSSSLNK